MSSAKIKRRFCDNAPLSIQQKNIWMEHEFYPDNISYNMVSCLRLSGDLNTEALKKSLAEIVRRHEVFRTTFSVIDSEPRQIIHQRMDVSTQIIFLTELSPEEQELEIKQTIYREAQLPFDLERGPLFRFVLLPLNKEVETRNVLPTCPEKCDQNARAPGTTVSHVFLITIHHLVMDGWSMGLFAKELATLYETFCGDSPFLLSEVGIQYSDYAIWQDEKQKESRERDAGYWAEVIKDSSFTGFPTDYPRLYGKKGESATRTITIPADLTEKLKSFSKKERATPFVTFLAGFQSILHRYTGRENLLSGCFTAGRDHSETRELTGQFSNLAVIKIDFSGDPDFREIIKRTRRAVFEANEHGQLLTRDLSEYQADEGSLNSPLFPVVFNYQNFKLPDWRLGSLDVKPEPIATGTARFDIEISIMPVGDEFEVTVQYRKDLYSENTIDRILNHYHNLLSSAIDNPDQPVHKLSMMSQAEIQQIVEDWNSEKAVYPTYATIHQLIDAAAKENQYGIALTYQGKDVTYKELINRSNLIARHLIKLGVGPEIMVGVYMTRSDNLIITLLTVLKAGGVYVPLDPIYPDEKLAYMLQNSTAPILLTEDMEARVNYELRITNYETSSFFPKEAGEKSAYPIKPEDFTIASKFPDYAGKIVNVESLLSSFSDETTYDLPPIKVASENSAYLIYTSGSTGKPKGVVVTHRNVVNEFCFADLYLDDADTSRTWLFSTSISFDPSVLEMFWTLSRGYKVVVLPDESSCKFLDINSIPEMITKYNVSHFQCTPSILRMLMERIGGFAALKQLKKLMVGGERFPVTLAKILSTETSIDIYNVYGPTETTLWATWYRLQSGDVNIPVGRPLPNYEIYILDRYLQTVPIGVYGEVCIGGDGVARGYFNDQELTARKYIPNPINRNFDELIYRTGDIARYRDDGIIEFLGRADRQVKIRGHRIEPGEVEAAIMDCGGVLEVVVIASGNTEFDQKLLGYLIPDFYPANEEELDSYIKNLKKALNKKLPGFMIPSSLTILKEFPKLSNGKIDRKALPVPELSANIATGTQNVLSSTESAIKEIWEYVLEYSDFDENSNYMEIGGNSLAAMIIINRIKYTLNVKVGIRDFLDNPTIKMLSRLIDYRSEITPSEPSDEIFSIDRDDEMPLSFFQGGRLKKELISDIGNVQYQHVSTWFSIKLSGNLDLVALEKAFNNVIKRHEMFRTAFWPVIDSTSPVTDKWSTVCQTCRINPRMILPKVKFKQSVQPVATMNLDYYDVSEYDVKDKNIEIRVIADRIIENRYVYESPPLTKAALIRVTEAEYILIVVASHIIADAVSMRIYEKELAYAYNALVNRQPVKLPDIELQYADYAAWMKLRLEAGSLDSMKSYWQEQFVGYMPTDVTILPFADMDGSKNDPDFSIDTKYYHRPVSDELSRAIRNYAGAVNITPFSIAMTGFILCLYCESGKTDIGVLTYFANRTRPETENIIGMFSTGNIIRIKINADDSFYQCGVTVSNCLNGATENQELMISPQDSRLHKSLYDRVISSPITCESWIDNECASFSGLRVEKVVLERNRSEYALKSFVIDTGSKLSLLFQYNLDLFDVADIKRIAARTESIIKEIITNPSGNITGIHKIHLKE